MGPVAAHVAHIRHLARPSALKELLERRHGVKAAESRERAQKVGPFLDQALSFHDVSRSAPLRVRPVLQYYTYLNLAVALVLIYQPLGWEQYRKHGVEDTTRELNRILLSSEVVRVRKGALALFHAIISESTLSKKKVSLQDLLVAIPMLGGELSHNFQIQPQLLEVLPDVRVIKEGKTLLARSQFTFRLHRRREGTRCRKGRSGFPLRRLYTAMPSLQTRYQLVGQGEAERTFLSRDKWSSGYKARAERFHSEMALKFVNFGGQQFSDEQSPNPIYGQSKIIYGWRLGDTSLLPTLTAGLLLSFSLASLCRYRASLLDRIEGSRINLLLEVFSGEADGFIIPAMRNLLYAETLYIHPSKHT